ncbi:MAG: hypothetical protein V1929_03040 [bacterium]
MKRLTQILVALALIVAVLLFGRNFIIKGMLERSAKALHGFDVTVGDVQVGIFHPLIRIRDLKITNPSDFPEKQALEAKEVLVRYDFLSLFSRETHFPEIVLDVPKAVVVWNAAGDMNYERLAGTGKKHAPLAKKKKKTSAPEKEAAPSRTVRIDKLTLRLVEAQIYDYRKGAEPSVMTFPMNMDKTYADVTNPDDLAVQIASELTANYLASLFGNVGKKMQDNGDTEKLDKMFKNLGKSINDLFKKSEN